MASSSPLLTVTGHVPGVARAQWHGDGWTLAHTRALAGSLAVMPIGLILLALGLGLGLGDFARFVSVFLEGCTTFVPVIASFAVGLSGAALWRVFALVEVERDGLRVCVRGGVTPLAWSEIRGIHIEKDLSGTTTVRIVGASTVRIDGMRFAQAYELRHAAAHLGGLPEPPDVDVQQHLNWKEARFVVRYPGPIEARHIYIDQRGLRVFHGLLEVVRVAWAEIQSIEREATGEVAWRTARDRTVLRLVPPEVSAAVLDGMQQQWEAFQRRTGVTEDAHERGKLDALRRQGAAHEEP